MLRELLRRSLATTLLLLSLATADLLGPAQAADPTWNPRNTLVFAVGVLHWQASDLYHSFPEENRRDAELIGELRERGVAADRLIFLKDEQATRKHIRAQLVRLLAKSKHDDWLILYFAGHGVRAGGVTYLANYDIAADTAGTGWAVPKIFDMIEEHFRGDRVMLWADCCSSGGLGIEAARRKGKISYGVLTSVEPSGTSTGHWTFTDCLLKGLRGNALVDLDHDGRVRLDELARYTEGEMAFAEKQLAWFSTTGRFDPKLVLAPAPPWSDQGAGTRVEVNWKGKWWPAYALANQAGQTRVHYAGFGNDWDEWVGPERIRPYLPQNLPAGARVEVSYEQKWWPARVLESRLGLQHIRYDGYGAQWDEWVGPDRWRAASTAR